MEQTFKETIITTETGKNIWVYDNLFTYQQRTWLYEYATSSLFRIRGSDNGILEYKEHISVVSTYTTHDLKDSQMLEFMPQEIKDKHRLSYDTADDTMVNLCTPADRFHVHVDNDSNGRTMVYYLNLNWHIEWGGDTLFTDESGENVEYVSQFKPGRLILFDPKIPHVIRPSTVLAPHFRFTLATKFIPIEI